MEAPTNCSHAKPTPCEPGKVLPEQLGRDDLDAWGQSTLVDEGEEGPDVPIIGAGRVRAEASLDANVREELGSQRSDKHGNVPPRVCLLGPEGALASAYVPRLLSRFSRDFRSEPPATVQYKSWSGPISRVLSCASIYLGLRLPTASCGQPGARAASG